MSRLLSLLFWLFVAGDLAILATLFLLGLAAAGPSHTPVSSVAGFFLLPAGVLVGLVLLFVRAPWPAARTLSAVLAGLPAIGVFGGAVFSNVAARLAGEPAQGWGQPDSALQRQVESAIASHDLATVARLSGGKAARLNHGATLVVALRRLEQHPGELDLLQTLLRSGLQPDAGGGAEAPLAAAIRISHAAGPEPVRLLLDAGADPNRRQGMEPAWFAALAPRTDAAVLPLLLARGADLRAVDMAGGNAVQAASRHGNPAAAALLVARGAAPLQP